MCVRAHMHVSIRHQHVCQVPVSQGRPCDSAPRVRLVHGPGGRECGGRPARPGLPGLAPRPQAGRGPAAVSERARRSRAQASALTSSDGISFYFLDKENINPNQRLQTLQPQRMSGWRPALCRRTRSGPTRSPPRAQGCRASGPRPRCKPFGARGWAPPARGNRAKRSGPILRSYFT